MTDIVEFLAESVRRLLQSGLLFEERVRLGLAAAALCLLLSALMLRRARRRNPADYRRQALDELDRLARQARAHDTREAALRALWPLIRGTAVAAWQHPSLDHFGTFQWLAFLDQTGEAEGFRFGVGRILPSLPRASDAALETLSEEIVGELFDLVREWIRTHRKHRGVYNAPPRAEAPCS